MVGRQRGGREAEIEERQRWNQKEHDRIMKSVNGACVLTYIYTYVHMYVRRCLIYSTSVLIRTLLVYTYMFFIMCPPFTHIVYVQCNRFVEYIIIALMQFNIIGCVEMYQQCSQCMRSDCLIIEGSFWVGVDDHVTKSV